MKKHKQLMSPVFGGGHGAWSPLTIQLHWNAELTLLRGLVHRDSLIYELREMAKAANE